MDRVQNFLRKLYLGVGSSRAKRYLRMLERGEWSLLQKESTSSPNVYQSGRAYLRDALVVEITRKLLLPSDASARRKAAVDTFWASETQCAVTNARLSKFIVNSGLAPEDMPIASFIDRWRAEIARVLGPLPDVLTPRFSGGSTLSDKGLCITIPDKLSSTPTVYAGSEDIVRHSFERTPFGSHATFTVVTANRFFTVPKDSFKDRGCCVEASSAVALQLDIDKLWKRRYEKAYQVRFDRLPDYHRWLAQVSSRFGTFATIDLSNASDTVARGLVRLLLPTHWYELLNSLRAKFTELDGRRVRLEKFSSMGNGFTFMLETILFRTLAATLGSRCATVFGDDIIIESEHSAAMLNALRFFGFTPNAKKTFCEGPFRESCGGDFWEGEPVRAHYLKELPSEPQHWVALANGLRRVDPDLHWCKSAWRFCIDQVPSVWRNFHADSSLGDFGFYDPQATPRRKGQTDPGSGVTADYWVGMVPIAETISLYKYFKPSVQLAAVVLGVEENVPLRGRIQGYRKTKIPVVGTNWTP